MAKRSREHRHEIPGYSEERPSREERKLQHRAVRHHTHQMLHIADDPDEIVVPEVRGTGAGHAAAEPPNPTKRRFKVWKTKFWKRRDDFQDLKSELDSNWPVITPNQLGEEES